MKREADERGATLLEFAIGATVFFTAMFGVLEFGRALWTHNALSDAARRAARYAINEPASTPAGKRVTGENVGPSVTAIKNVAVYGNPEGTGQPLVNNLATENIKIAYSNFGLGDGSVSVTITNYKFQFIVPIVGTSITMPNYNTTLTGESVGTAPDPL
ncbi:MAG TPA: TadE family protein [Pyrinomonadaceae bacterium]